MRSFVPGPVAAVLDLMVTLFVLCVGLGVAVVIVMLIIDITQHRDAIRHNYPVVGRFRDLFITLGEFFRQ
jgi:hypothetical protein